MMHSFPHRFCPVCCSCELPYILSYGFDSQQHCAGEISRYSLLQTTRPQMCLNMHGLKL